MHLTPLDDISSPALLASSASLWCFTQAAAQVRPGMATQAPVTGRDTSTARQVWYPRPFKTLWNHPRNHLCAEKWHFIHHFKATQDCALLRQMLPSPLLCSPDPPAKQEAQDDPATTDPTASVCLLRIFYQSSDLSHQAAAWWTEPKEMRTGTQEGN